MGTYSDLAKQAPISAQRLRTFGEFVAKNKGGMEMYLHGNIWDEWYEPAKFDRGNYNCCRILLGDKNPKLIRFDSLDEANGYAKSLLGVLKEKGFAHSKARGEKVYVRGTVTSKWLLGTQSNVTLLDAPTYIVRMDIKK